jgi:hypothetical protein
MSKGWDYVSELWPPTGLLFIPQVIHENGEPWWNDIDSGKLKHSQKKLCQCHYVHVMDWPRSKPKPPWWKTKHPSHGMADTTTTTTVTVTGGIIQGIPCTATISYTLLHLSSNYSWFIHQSHLEITSRDTSSEAGETWWELVANFAYRSLFSYL